MFSKLEKSTFLFIVVCLAYVAVAFNSSGYYHWDEHYQIIEFANYKLGYSAKENLAWEYEAAIRPSLQVGICYLIFKVFHAFRITDPFVLAFILRMFTALAAVIAIRIFINSSKTLIKSELMPYFVIISYFLWFLPFINVRFAAESWSGLFFLMTVALVQSGFYKKRTIWVFMVAFLLGISVLFKYQSALLGVGLFLWIVFVDRPGIKKIILMIAGVFLVLGLGFLMDRWMYGRYVFTLYNYFYVNLVQGIASNFGTSPWYEIIFYILKDPGPILGLVILLSLIYIIIHNPKNVIVWSVLPYLIVHAIIPHKELRFLFPLVNLIPFILIYAYQQYAVHLTHLRYWIWSFVFLLMIVVNFAGLVVISTKGAGKGKIAIPAYINCHYKMQPVNLIYADGANPYQEWESPKNTFYVHHEMSFTPIETIWNSDLTKQLKTGYVNLLVIPASDMTGPETYKYLQELKFKAVHQNIPWIVQHINDWFGQSNNDEILNLFEYQGKQ